MTQEILQSSDDRVRDSLEWYGSISAAVLSSDKQALLALMQEMALDYGKKAEAALKELT